MIIKTILNIFLYFILDIIARTQAAIYDKKSKKITNSYALAVEDEISPFPPEIIKNIIGITNIHTSEMIHSIILPLLFFCKLLSINQLLSFVNTV